ncbi:DUF3152 domain-containing protein [Kribbella sp. CA-247076]|uniref:DUF3152 domain-containing protein n=1 Tax=Kribbella sp. CA-247076 TaxID=3239941 RepID=UPI003D92F112
MTGSAAVVVVAVAGLYQLPAGPSGGHGYPARPAADVVEPDAEVPVRPVEPGDRSASAPARSRPAITYPARGTGSYGVLPGNPAVIGRSGRLYTYQLAIEGGINGIDRTALAQFVRATYGAPQGWASGGKFRFRQVGPGEDADFTVMLVTPATRDAVCRDGYDRYTSCRIGDRVVLNVARWVHGVPQYGASLSAYRQYMINHETGHRLGRGHELCPGRGRPAPVMQQQTLGMHGCTPYSWPYRDGVRYQGRPGQYDDPIPR